MNGWLKLHRKLMESPVWQNSSSSHKVVLMTILMQANHEEKNWWDRSAKENIVLEPGSFTTSYRTLAEDAEVSVKAVRNALDRLGAQGFIQVEARTTFTLIRVCNWSYYQSDSAEDAAEGTDGGTAGAQDRTREGTQDRTREGTQDRTREGTRKKEVKKKEEESAAVPPYEDVFDTWNRFAKKTGVPSVQAKNDDRRRKIKTRWREWDEHSGSEDTFEFYRRLLHRAMKQPFLMGDSNRGWVMKFDWLFSNSTNWAKVWEGNYENNGTQKGKYDTSYPPGTKENPVDRVDGQYVQRADGKVVDVSDLKSE